MGTMLVRVDGSFLTAGFVLDLKTRRCIQAAPIIKYFIGKSATWIRNYCDKRGWVAKRVP